jgi:phospholipid-binding lipoprotein MlaA
MRRPLGAALLPLALVALAACAAVPGEELGSVPPRSPPTATERLADHPLAVHDPWEGFNRGVYWFNTDLDRKILLPVLRGYEFVVPDVAQQGVSNFFNNLRELQNGVNGALQLRGEVVGTAFGRFFINSTLGVFGLFDLATEFGYREQREDFGQTLGRWGVGPGPYLVLPLFGPSSLRDAGGLAFDFTVTSQTPGPALVNQEVYRNPSVYGLYGVDQRRQVQFRYYQSGSPFEYDLVRFLYLKRRQLDILK